jgi:hypothetical protein
MLDSVINTTWPNRCSPQCQQRLSMPALPPLSPLFRWPLNLRRRKTRLITLRSACHHFGRLQVTRHERTVYQRTGALPNDERTDTHAGLGMPDHFVFQTKPPLSWLAQLNQFSFFGCVLDLIGFEPRLTAGHEDLGWVTSAFRF